ncbi:sigma factor-like helix-turn-helix DNA-binding protein [Bacillus mycoides]|uniref:sigma factor-like helix-turn-helix DNA-binding protein n=1 Tax=Bacillus mycoides TaxID=1405 RepID=UPI001F2C82B3|nr:sigma factor-like helix-turn-helix DNA-binding protein [Bacillus mycoides]
MQRYFRSTDDNKYEWDNHALDYKIGEWEKIQLKEALSDLAFREKEVYLMSRREGLSYNEISKYSVISRSSVQKMLERADMKIRRQVRERLFCISYY